MRVVVHDFSGHPFQVELSRSLAQRGHDVLHVDCASFTTPKGNLVARDSEQGRLTFESIDLGKTFDKYSPVRRLRQEVEYGRRFVRVAEAFAPDIVISSNDPLLAKRVSASWCRRSKTPWIFWLQDIYSIAMANAASRRLPLLGHAAGAVFRSVERRLLRRSASVIAITDDFLPTLREWNIAPDKCHVIENWAPLGDIPLRPRQNRWALEQGLGEKFVFLYSGTLGLKHDPELLVRLARHFEARDDVRLVVASEGPGADHIAAAQLHNVLLIGFQPFDAFPDVLATADALLVVLEPDAGVFSVPSKVLSYHCAGRPLLASIPAENLAARIISENRSGIVVDPNDDDAWINAADRLVDDEQLREQFGANARDYAVRKFDIDTITSRFEGVLNAAATPRR